jgi:ATP-dependent helicase/DNAse subunit B
MAMTRASERLIVSRPATDEDGRPQLASSFWDELQRLTSCGGKSPGVERVSARDTELTLEQCGNIEEVRRVAFSRLAGGGKESADLLAALAALDATTAATLASAAVAHERESSHPFGHYDAVLASPDILNELAQRFPGEHVFSISRLEDYAMCPFRFFAVTVLGLEAGELPEEYFLETQVGDLYHDILRDFYVGRRRAGQTRLDQVPAGTLHDEMMAAVGGVFAAREAAGEGGLPALWRIQQEEITERLIGYVDAESARCAAAPLAIEPRWFEWSFGTGCHDRDDPQSAVDPLIVPSPHGPVRIRGRIDRVDVLTAGGTPEALAVIDYKSGGKPGGLGASLAAGQALQLPLYLMALAAIVGPTIKARPAQGIYYYLRDLEAYAALDALGAAKKASQFDAIIEAARSAVAAIIKQLRQGRFAPVPGGGCPSWCEFRGLCRTARWRIERKTTEEPRAADQ